MFQVLSGPSREQRRRLIRAHPDLAGRRKLSELTADSRNEQSSAGLDSLTAEERDRFLDLNDLYKEKFGFPFILAVKGRTKDEILAAFEERLEHDLEQEFATAIVQIELIALLRLKDRLPSLADVFSGLA